MSEFEETVQHWMKYRNCTEHEVRRLVFWACAYGRFLRWENEALNRK